MKTIILFLLALSLGLESCGKHVTGSKNIVEKEIRTESFSAIASVGSFDIFYTQRPGAPSVKVITSDNVIDILEIYVKGGTLHIGVKPGYGLSAKKLEVHIGSDMLSGINLTGSGDAKLLGNIRVKELKLAVTGSGDIEGSTLECQQLNLSVTGSGDMDLGQVSSNFLAAEVAGSGELQIKQLDADEARFNIAGSGEIEVKGTAQKAHYSIAGSGEIDAEQLQANYVEASTAGSGEITCYATDFLKARTSGSGDISYKGNPQLDVSQRGIHPIR